MCGMEASRIIRSGFKSFAFLMASKLNGFAANTKLVVLFKVGANKFTHLGKIVNDKDALAGL
jgi:hypothetical protein